MKLLMKMFQCNNSDFPQESFLFFVFLLFIEINKPLILIGEREALQLLTLLNSCWYIAAIPITALLNRAVPGMY